MADFLIALGILVLLGVGAAVVVRVRKNGTEVKDQRDPEQPRNVERMRAASEAEAAKDEPLSPADAEEAAELVAWVEEIGTGEQFLVLAFDADPLSAPIPEDLGFAEPDTFHEVTAGWLSQFTWSLPAEPATPLSSVKVIEPDPLLLESFTTGWSRDEIAAILAKGKAGASR